MPKKQSREIRFTTSVVPSPKDKFQIEPGRVKFYDFRPYFSFRYYHKNSKYLSVKRLKNKNEFKVFIEKLQELSQYTWRDIFNNKKIFHAHKVDWSETNYQKGFTHLPENIREIPAYQFRVFKECRVLGFFNHHNVFKIVWIDREHRVYGKRK